MKRRSFLKGLAATVAAAAVAPRVVPDILQSLAPAPRVIESGRIIEVSIVGYDLEAPSRWIYPVMTPLRNTFPRTLSARFVVDKWRDD
jgi:hypothetical protein